MLKLFFFAPPLFAPPLRRQAAPAVLRDGGADVEAARSVGVAFEELKASPAFAEAWDEDRPLVVSSFFLSSPNTFVGFFGFDDLRLACERGEVGEAGRGVVQADGSWHMARVGERGREVPWVAVEECLSRSSTVVLNSADAHCPRLAAMSLAAIDAFELPVCLNVYATGRDASVSAPPHSDAQRVLVAQTQGRKRWRVYEPPSPRKRPLADPLARGKGRDALSSSELARDPLVDVVLEPGQLLYVPAGFPHTTQTLPEDRSLHLTLGVDTHIWALDAKQARAGALRRVGLADGLRPEADLDAALYWTHSRKTLPRLGWRRHAEDSSAPSVIADFIADAADRVEPRRFPDRAAAKKALDADVVANRLIDHANNLVDVQRGLYNDVLFHDPNGPFKADDDDDDDGREKKKKTEQKTNNDDEKKKKKTTPLPVAARVKAHFARLEKTQTDLAAWFARGTAPPDAAKSPYKAGSEVQAKIFGTDDFFDAVVDLVRPDGSCDVVFFDGDVEFGVTPDRLRPRATAPTPKKPAKAGFGGGKRPPRAAASAGGKKGKKRKR